MTRARANLRHAGFPRWVEDPHSIIGWLATQGWLLFMGAAPLPNLIPGQTTPETSYPKPELLTLIGRKQIVVIIALLERVI